MSTFLCYNKIIFFLGESFMKKLLITLTLILTLCLTAFTLTACTKNNGDNIPHIHEYTTEYTFDNDYHWFECECGEDKGNTAHVLNNGVCICGYEEKETHIHDYGMLMSDTENHWYECDCGDKKYMSNHKGGNSTCIDKAVCVICGEKYGEYGVHNADELSGFCMICNEPINPTIGLKYSVDIDVTGERYAKVVGYEGTSVKVNIASSYAGYPVKEIEEKVFSGATIIRVIIPDSVTTIGSFNFSQNNSLKSIVLGRGLTTIDNGAFSGCDSLTSIEIPDSVTSIGDSAFSSCRSLTSIVIPNSVTSIGSSTFSGCTSLTSIEIPDSVTSIGAGAFSYCSNLTSVTFGENSQLTSIGSSAFSNCYSLTSIVIPASVTSIGSSAFSICYRLVEVINKSNHITVTKGSSDNGYLGYYALSVSNREDNYVSKLSTDANGFVIYTEGEEKILVNYLGSETDITIPNGITKINNSAFYNCYSLTSIEIPNSVISIGSSAFYNCTSLESIEIPASVISIGDCAFYNCRTLTIIEIPASVTSIGYQAFSGCSALTTIYCEAESEPSGWGSSWKSGCSATVVWGDNGEN